MFKNTASQKLAVYAWDRTTGNPKTGDAGNITAGISKDGGTSAATDDTNPTELDAADHPGIYIFDVTQAETNADLVVVTPVSSTENIVLDAAIIHTRQKLNLSSGVVESNLKQIEGVAVVDDGAGRISTTAELLGTTIAGITSTKDFTLTAGPPGTVSFIDCIAVIYDASNSDLPDIRRVTAWEGGTKLLSIDSGPGFVAAIGDTVRIFAFMPQVALTGDQMNLADDAITREKFDESTAFPLKSADTGASEVARTGADGDTLKDVSDQVDAVKGQTDRIGASQMSVSSPVTSSGSIEIYQGFDYNDTDGTALSFTCSGALDLTVEGTILTFEIETTQDYFAGNATPALSVTATTGDGTTIKVQLTAAQTAALQGVPPEGKYNYRYILYATLPSARKTPLAGGAMTVKQGI